jgi:hypothetical protein
MVKASEVAVCALGLAAATWLCIGSAFIAGPRIPGASSPEPRFLAPLVAPAAEQEAPAGSFAPLLAGAAAGLAAAGIAAASVRRSSTARAAIERAKSEDVTFAVVPGQFDKPFCSSLVGTEYHGWGTYEFDPLLLSDTWPEHLPWYREAELKHGRVAMLACLGLIVPDAIRIPGEQFAAADLDMLTAHNRLIGPGLGEGPMWYLLAFCGIIESLRFKQLGLDFGDLTLDTAGDLGFGKSFFPTTKEGQTQMRIKELKNGRLAMLAFGGAITQGIAWECHHFPFVPTE